jgi:hypothetical protein
MLHALRSRSHFGETMADRIVRETLEARAVGGGHPCSRCNACRCMQYTMNGRLSSAAGKQVCSRSAGGAVLAMGTAA